MKTDTLKSLQATCLLMMGYTFYPVSSCFVSGNYEKALWMAAPLAVVIAGFHWITYELRRRERGEPLGLGVRDGG